MITFNNKLPKGTTIHWHGLDAPNSMDGVPGVTQQAVKAVESFNKAMVDVDMDYNLFTMNRLAFPDTKNMDDKKGDKVRNRLISASAGTTHPMHLHGQQFKITATDGNPAPEAAQLTRNVVTLNPGETYDIEFTANNPGVSAFRCHESHYAGAGMMTLLKYEGLDPPAKPSTGSQDTPNMGGMGGMEGV